jgi:ribosome biogenesis GTPase / thiamine phosphate phosphatase
VHPHDAHPLAELGWDTDFAERLAELGDPTLEPARVAADHGARLLVHVARGAEPAALAAALRAGERPVVGDWGATARRGSLEVRSVLARRSAIRRKVPEDESREQILAANVDLVIIATALDGDFNQRRIERLLTLAYQGGAAPLVLLTKADLAPPGAAPAALDGVSAVAPGVPTLVVSTRTAEGLEALRDHLHAGRTAVLLGSSGVGKSTLVNRLLGAGVLPTRETHRTGQGRHTTSHRQLLLLPGGGAVIDTPGLRELQLWAGRDGGLQRGDDGLGGVFGDVEGLARECRFADCRHEREPGCAVQEAMDDGRLDPARLASYRKLGRELRRVRARTDARLRAEELRRWKALTRAGREQGRAKRGRHG